MAKHNHRAEMHEPTHIEFQHSHLNLVDLCKDSAGKTKDGSLKSIAVKALESELIELSEDSTDNIVNALSDYFEKLDYRGTRVLEEKYGKSDLTRTLDKTRHERYRIFGLVAAEALKVGLEVIERKMD